MRKSVSVESEMIYRFIQANPSPYVPKIYDCAVEGNQLMILEEYIVGRNLEELLAEKTFSEPEAARIMLELCEALKPFHHAQPPIVCRDLKPANIMLNQTGNVKIVDFDIARIYEEGKNRDTKLLGTAEYAAPEQYGYSQTDSRTDIYALGVVLNYMVTGQFPGEQMISGDLEKIVRKCTRMDPGERYQSVEELEEDLKIVCESNRWRIEAVGKENCNAPDGLYGAREGVAEKDAIEGAEKSSERGFIPPGFRSRTPWKMIVALMGYAFVTWFCFTLDFEREGVTVQNGLVFFEQFMVWISQLAFIGIVWDYRGCKRYLPFLNQKKAGRRVLRYLLLDFVLLFLAAILCAVGEIILA